jgi:hypothetical protein
VSYDLYALSVPAGQDASAVFDSFMEAEEAGQQTAWTDEQIARMERLAASLQTLNPRLERFAFDYAEIARVRAFTEAEARAQFRHTELNSPEGDYPIQVIIYANHAFLTVPYWHTGDRAHETMTEAFSYLALLEREAGRIIMDPQIGRVLSLSRDLGEVVTTYERGTRQLQNTAAKNLPSPPTDEHARRKKRFGLF